MERRRKGKKSSGRDEPFLPSLWYTISTCESLYSAARYYALLSFYAEKLSCQLSAKCDTVRVKRLAPQVRNRSRLVTARTGDTQTPAAFHVYTAVRLCGICRRATKETTIFALKRAGHNTAPHPMLTYPKHHKISCMQDQTLTSFPFSSGKANPAISTIKIRPTQRCPTRDGVESPPQPFTPEPNEPTRTQNGGKMKTNRWRFQGQGPGERETIRSALACLV